MKKRVYGKKLGRERDTRRALFRSLIRALCTNGKIKTTKAKAKAVQPSIDKLINLAKEGSVSSHRRLHAFMGNDKQTSKRIIEIAPNLKGRNSGYTRVIKIGRRRGDRAEMVRLEWVDQIPSKKDEKGKKSDDKKKSSKKKETSKKKSKKKDSKK